MGWTRRFATASLTLNVVHAVRVIGDVLLFGGGALLYASADGPWEVLHTSGVAIAGMGTSFVGWLLDRGARWVRAEGEDRLDRRTSHLLSAALRSAHTGPPEGLHATLSQVLRHVVEVARSHCSRDGDLLAVLLRRDADGVLRVASFSDFRGDHAPEAQIPDDGAIPGAAAACKDLAVQYIPDNADVPSFEGKAYRCLLCFPLVRGEQCIGVLTLDSTKPHHFDGVIGDLDAHIRPLVEVAGIVLHTLQTLEEANRESA